MFSHASNPRLIEHTIPTTQVICFSDTIFHHFTKYLPTYPLICLLRMQRRRFKIVIALRIEKFYSAIWIIGIFGYFWGKNKMTWVSAVVMGSLNTDLPFFVKIEPALAVTFHARPVTVSLRAAVILIHVEVSFVVNLRFPLPGFQQVILRETLNKQYTLWLDSKRQAVSNQAPRPMQSPNLGSMAIPTIHF